MKDNVIIARSEALKRTKEVLATRFQGYAFAFAAGSIMRGEGKNTSDVDLVVVFDRLATAWRESFVEDHLPFEAFVHDPETLSWFFENDMALGYPIIIHMVASGHILGRDVVQAKACQAHARRLLDQGAPPLSAAKLDALRYQITDLLADLSDERGIEDTRAITAQLYQPLADLMLLTRGRWSGKGKWIPRLLKAFDKVLFEGFDRSFALALAGDAKQLIEFTGAELTRTGGAYFHGDRREASQTARRSRRW
ncbi:nucleotidyltransferase domain-containing protein [Agrobacterium rhizogenes]|uniref:nucleotidyltransferase domain-containing protein n=1 Tax=Rhizobium rhizogenes TaxID=359 RepID=UPI0015724690|nr:nucleotidyltransferase domain-containing protein [Rhizobium rhizogenes]NTF89933.1 nucleotidyltransferase domain-containing protein [Rhizobium rhizogenes]